MSEDAVYTLSTDEYRDAVQHARCPGCAGAFSGSAHSQPMRDWHDKPHRLVYDLCDEIDHLRAALAAHDTRSQRDETERWKGDAKRYAQKAERWHERADELERELAEARGEVLFRGPAGEAPPLLDLKYGDYAFSLAFDDEVVVVRAAQEKETPNG